MNPYDNESATLRFRTQDGQTVNVPVKNLQYSDTPTVGRPYGFTTFAEPCTQPRPLLLGRAKAKR